jgi:hypothetical protein
LLREHRADEADNRFAVGEDTDDVGAPADLFVETFLGVVGANLAPVLLGLATSPLCPFGLIGQVS